MRASSVRARRGVGHERSQAEFPVFAREFPVLLKKIPCYARENSLFRLRREFRCK